MIRTAFRRDMLWHQTSDTVSFLCELKMSHVSFFFSGNDDIYVFYYGIERVYRKIMTQKIGSRHLGFT